MDDSGCIPAVFTATYNRDVAQTVLKQSEVYLQYIYGPWPSEFSGT